MLFGVIWCYLVLVCLCIIYFFLRYLDPRFPIIIIVFVMKPNITTIDTMFIELFTLDSIYLVFIGILAGIGLFRYIKKTIYSCIIELKVY